MTQSRGELLVTKLQLGNEKLFNSPLTEELLWAKKVLDILQFFY